MGNVHKQAVSAMSNVAMMESSGTWVMQKINIPADLNSTNMASHVILTIWDSQETQHL